MGQSQSDRLRFLTLTSRIPPTHHAIGELPEAGCPGDNLGHMYSSARNPADLLLVARVRQNAE